MVICQQVKYIVEKETKVHEIQGFFYVLRIYILRKLDEDGIAKSIIII